MESRSALIIATSAYHDTTFQRLRSPARDAAELASVLGDPAIGGFQVTSITDSTNQQWKVGVDEYLDGRVFDDLLVLYISGHGVRDARGRLYFVAADTVHSRLAATGVEALWLLDRLEECRARQQVIILDCCFSGAFAAGAKGGGDDLSSSLAELSGHGRGRVVLTASRATEYSFEGYAVPSAAIAGSVFTAGLIDGLRSGAADVHQAGRISVDDAFAYAFDFVRRHGVNQTPQRWSYGVEGTIWLARASTGPPAPAAYTPNPVPERPPSVLTPEPFEQRRTARAGTVIGWGGRNPSLARALATVLEFGRLVVPAGLSGVTAIAAGGRHGLALTAEGEVVAWGENAFGQARVPRRLDKVRAIAAGSGHNLAIRADGSVVGWGNNNGGQARAPKSLGEAVEVAAGGWHSLALLRDGTVAAWGENHDGQTRIPPGLHHVVAVAAGEAHSLALHADGTVMAWGRNNYGQSTVPLEAVGVSAIAAGTAYSVALRGDGRLISWGRALAGSPRHLADGEARLSAGESHCLALGGNGILHAWGDNSYEQCDVPHGLGGIISVSAGGAFSLALIAGAPG